MSMVGYILGLGDRHPSNLMLDRLSGKILHIDFGDCFEVAMTREKFPEKIPFRLTRMLVNAMEVVNQKYNDILKHLQNELWLGDWTNWRNLPKHLRIRNGCPPREQRQFNGCIGSFCLRSSPKLETGIYSHNDLLHDKNLPEMLFYFNFKVVDNVANPKTTRRSKSRHASSSNNSGQVRIFRNSLAEFVVKFKLCRVMSGIAWK